MQRHTALSTKIPSIIYVDYVDYVARTLRTRITSFRTNKTLASLAAAPGESKEFLLSRLSSQMEFIRIGR